ncbi:cytochrome c oxidase subunit II [Halobacteriaceae archaeon GCM10025711]
MFQQIYWVFLVLGTIVGVVVIGYMLYNAYRYRESAGEAGDDADHPRLGELPQGGGKGRKLLLTFTLSTIIVVGLVLWTYGTLLYVEQDSPVQDQDHLAVEVVGFQFGWQFVYPNGRTTNELRVPAGTPVELTVTSRDVFHSFGIPALRVKTDAIPGTTTDTWFVAEEPAEYRAQCFELCGPGHSVMHAPVVVMEEDAFDRWYENSTQQANTTSA